MFNFGYVVRGNKFNYQDGVWFIKRTPKTNWLFNYNRINKNTDWVPFTALHLSINFFLNLQEQREILKDLKAIA